jgi:hypothetical protein
MRPLATPVQPKCVRGTSAAIQVPEEAFAASKAAEVFRQTAESHVQLGWLQGTPCVCAPTKQCALSSSLRNTRGSSREDGRGDTEMYTVAISIRRECWDCRPPGVRLPMLLCELPEVFDHNVTKRCRYALRMKLHSIVRSVCMCDGHENSFRCCVKPVAVPWIRPMGLRFWCRRGLRDGVMAAACPSDGLQTRRQRLLHHRQGMIPHHIKATLRTCM